MTDDDLIKRCTVLDSLINTGWEALDAGREKEAEMAFDEVIARGNDPSGLYSGFVGIAHVGRAAVFNLRMQRDNVDISSGPGIMLISSKHGGHLFHGKMYAELFDAVTQLERAIETGQASPLVYWYLIGTYLDISQMLGDVMPWEESIGWIEKALKTYGECPGKASPIIQANYAIALAYRSRAYLNRWRDLEPEKRHRGILYVFGNLKDKGRDHEFRQEALTSATRALSVLSKLDDSAFEEKMLEAREIAEEVLRTLSR